MDYAFSYDYLWTYTPDGSQEPRIVPDGQIVLSVPDIMAARRGGNPLDDVLGNPWRTSYVTSSAEYRGLSAAGNDVVAIHHPQASHDFVAPGQLDHEQFLALLDGAYGAVSVFDTDLVYDRNMPFRRLWPSIAARVGGEDIAFSVLKQIERQTGKTVGGALFAGPTTSHMSERLGDRRQVKFSGLSAYALNAINKKQQMDLEGIVTTAEATIFRRTMALAVGHSNSAFPERSRVAARKGRGSPTAIAPAVTMDMAVLDPERKAWLAETEIADASEALTRLQVMFGSVVTDRDRHIVPIFGSKAYRGWPGNPVTSFEEIGDLVKCNKFAVDDETLARAPAGANAYLLVANDRGVIGIVFGRAVVDKTVRFPTREEFGDWDTRAELAEHYANEWWKRREADRLNSEGVRCYRTL